jgi:hypothetical protein
MREATLRSCKHASTHARFMSRSLCDVTRNTLTVMRLLTHALLNVTPSGKCTAVQEVTLRPCVLHANSASIAFVDVRRCRVADVLPSDLHAACADCSEEYPLKGVRRGVRAEHACFKCHHKLAFECKHVRIEVLSQPSEDAAAAGRGVAAAGGGGARSGGGPKIVEGTELPNLGACDHFKKSLRWLRFPCCGKA